MVTNIKISNINLYELEQKFNLTFVDDDTFFPEYRHNLPQLSDTEKQTLDEVKIDFRHLSKYPVLEPIVKLVVISPLLKLAGFLSPPFYLTAEKEVKLYSEDEESSVTGKLDFLVFTPQFWILLIEAKGIKYSLEEGIPQALAYMLTNQEKDRPGFGFVTNGIDFVFLKLQQEEIPKYSESDRYSLYRQDDLQTVLRIFKRMAQLVQ